MEQFIKYYKDRPISLTIPHNDGKKILIKLLEVKEGKILEDGSSIKIIVLRVINKEDNHWFTDNILHHYASHEIHTIFNLFSIEDQFMISFS